MFRTEVVTSKNIRKTVFYKIYNVVALLVFLFILMILLNVFSADSAAGKFIQDNYNSVIRPGILILAFLIFIMSTVIRSSSKSPKRLGTLEMDENEIKYLVNDEVQETIPVNELKSIEFEYYSFRMRGNPVGCMNYLKLENNHGTKTYEIVIANSMVKAEFGDLLSKINQKVKVNVTYAYFLKKLLKDQDFKF